MQVSTRPLLDIEQVSGQMTIDLSHPEPQVDCPDMARSRLILLRLCAVVLCSACAVSRSFGSEPNDLAVATPESQGVDSRPLEECLRYIRSEHLRIHSLLVVRHGRVVLDAYF